MMNRVKVPASRYPTNMDENKKQAMRYIGLREKVSARKPEKGLTNNTAMVKQDNTNPTIVLLVFRLSMR